MERENRYAIFKRSDVAEALTPAERSEFIRLEDKVALSRTQRGKNDLKCVVVESDWPEYEPTWNAIAERVDGSGGYMKDREEKPLLKHFRLNLLFYAQATLGMAIIGSAAPIVTTLLGHESSQSSSMVFLEQIGGFFEIPTIIGAILTSIGIYAQWRNNKKRG